MDVREAGVLGGNATLKKYGKDHYRKMRQKSRGRQKNTVI